jgi:hypothetical protein
MSLFEDYVQQFIGEYQDACRAGPWLKPELAEDELAKLSTAVDDSTVFRFLAFAMATHDRLGQDAVSNGLEQNLVVMILSSIWEAEYRELLHAREHVSKMIKKEASDNDPQEQKQTEVSNLDTVLKAMNEVDAKLAVSVLAPSTVKALLEWHEEYEASGGLSKSLCFSYRRPEPAPFFDAKRRLWIFLDEEIVRIPTLDEFRLRQRMVWDFFLRR